MRLHSAAADSSEASEPDLVVPLVLDDWPIDLRLGVPQRSSARWAEAKLEEDASFRLENVPPGRYLVALEGDALPRVTPVPVDVVADGIQVITLTATYAVMAEIDLTIKDRSGADVVLRRGIVTFTERRPAGVLARTGVLRRSIGGASTTFVAPLFRSRYDVNATFGSSASSVVLPRPSARTSFVVPAGIEAPRVAVRLVVEPVRREAVIVGRVELDEDEMPYGFTALATTPDGVAIEVRLKLSPDGTFRLRVDLDRVSGPQIEIESRRHRASLGPFALDVGAIDLGELRFARPVPKSLPR